MASGENKRPTKMAEEYTQRKPNTSYLYSMIILQTWSPDKQTRQSDYRFPFFCCFWEEYFVFSIPTFPQLLDINGLSRMD